MGFYPALTVAEKAFELSNWLLDCWGLPQCAVSDIGLEVVLWACLLYPLQIHVLDLTVRPFIGMMSIFFKQARDTEADN